MSGVEDSLGQLGIHRIAVPTPFLIGSVNAYLIEDQPLTLVDTGPNVASSFDVLEREVLARGHRIEDIELVLVTHQHIDHVGLVRSIVERSGAEVGCLDALAPHVVAYVEFARRDDRLMVQQMRDHGVDERTVTSLKPFFALKRCLGSSFATTRRLMDGDVVELRDRRLRVLHRPGHSPSDTMFCDEENGIAFGGDHLLSGVSSNPVMSVALADEPDGKAPMVRAPSLVAYLASLKATRELDVEVILGGHGDAVTDHRALIDERVIHHAERGEAILELLLEGTSTAHGLATRIWGPAAQTQAHLTLSEILGHLDLLMLRGAVAAERGEDATRFVAL